MEHDIYSAISRYCETQDKIKELKKISDEDKATIKAIMIRGGDTNKTSNGWVVTLREKKTEDINPEKLLNVVKADWAKNHGSIQCPFIRTQEYVDMELLEKAVYNGEISNELLLEIDKCREVKVTKALYYSKEKTE